jgi:hypothetical protein
VRRADIFRPSYITLPGTSTALAIKKRVDQLRKEVTMTSNNDSNNLDPKQVQRLINRKVYIQLLGGIGIISIPISIWWYWSKQERHQLLEEYRTRVKLPPSAGSSDTYDYLITEKIQPGDVILFDRRCERCASSPWSALACIVSKQLLSGKSGNDNYIRSIDTGRYNHIGLVVPGYIRTRSDEYDPLNLLLLEATPGGIVARPLKERLELSTAHSVILLQLASPGEQRNKIVDNPTDSQSSQQILVARTREHVVKELKRYRDTWVSLGTQYNYQYLHSTLTIGGAITYALGLYEIFQSSSTFSIKGPVSPSAYFVLSALQQAAAAPSITDQENFKIKPEDFLRDYRLTEKNAVRLRPGWRFLAPITLKQSSTSN